MLMGASNTCQDFGRMQAANISIETNDNIFKVKIFLDLSLSDIGLRRHALQAICSGKPFTRTDLHLLASPSRSVNSAVRHVPSTFFSWPILNRFVGVFTIQQTRSYFCFLFRNSIAFITEPQNFYFASWKPQVVRARSFPEKNLVLTMTSAKQSAGPCIVALWDRSMF